jgi:hypothetical protein
MVHPKGDPMSTDLHVIVAEQRDVRLGRQVVHDPQSRSFAFGAPPVEQLPTVAKRHRLYGPRTTPSQPAGCCTGVDQCVKGNAVGNRVPGEVLGIDTAMRLYARATQIDPFRGTYPPDDTGSSGLAACKAATEAGIITRYEWLFAGTKQVLAALYGTADKPGRPVGLGTWWFEGMFEPARGTLLVEPTGAKAGGHQWTAIGYEPKLDAIEGMCWWGPGFGDRGLFRIRRRHLAELLADDGDAHVTYRRG